MTDMIVRHCAPTLAGLKAGNLFSYKYTDLRQLHLDILKQNRELNGKGVFFVLIKASDGLALVYLYRKKQLEKILSGSDTQAFLRKHGYRDFSISACLMRLHDRLQGENFPHEIGVFLGYPLDDIISFIDNRGANCKCSGFWKAYNNIGEAEKTFQRFDKCIKIYCEKYTAGSDLQRLTVAI